MWKTCTKVQVRGTYELVGIKNELEDFATIV